MSTVFDWTATRFSVPSAGFDSIYRYLQQATGGTLTVSAGRTWRMGDYQLHPQNNSPWLAWRFDVGVSGAAVNMVAATQSGNTQTSTCPAVGPTTTGSVALS